MTAGGDEPRGIGPGEPIGMMTLMRGAEARVRAGAAPLAGLWLALIAGDAGLDRWARALGVDPGQAARSLDWLYYALADSALDGLCAAAVLRVILSGRLWLDRRFFECAGLFALNALLLTFIMSGMEQADLWVGLVVLACELVAAFAALKLVLWPLARLAGQGGVTPARSWALMRRATAGLWWANVLFLIPVVVVGLAREGVVAENSLAADLIDAIISQAYAILGAALAATVYQLRVGNPATVADVFD